MFDFVDRVVYINLEHRLDRKAQVESELLKYIPAEKIQRFNAIKHVKGAAGCTMSHIAVLKMAIEQGWPNYMVVEDDATWNMFNRGYAILEKISKHDYDVLVLGGTLLRVDSNYKLASGQTTTAYIVHSGYYSKLLENFEEGLSGFLRTDNYPMYAIDQYWKHLQAKDKWYCVVPSLMIQRPSYSDIDKAFRDNQRWFN